METPNRPEPFATILDLCAEHGTLEVLRDVSCMAELDSESEDFCAGHRRIARRLHLELELLIERIDDLEAAIMHPEEPGIN